MRAVIQRVLHAEVKIGDRISGSIDNGMLVLLGVHREDTITDVTWMAEKLIHLRIFEDEKGLMNKSLLDIGGQMLIVSQFTLLGDCRKGRRPSWSSAAPPERAKALYIQLVAEIGKSGIHAATGEFQAMMNVSLINNGPVTLLLDSHKKI